MEVAGISIGKVPREGEIDIEVQGENASGVLGVLGIAVQDTAPAGQALPQDFQDIGAGVTDPRALGGTGSVATLVPDRYVFF